MGAQEDQLTLHKQYLAVFDGPAGAKVLADIYRQGMMDLSTFDLGGKLAPSDPFKSAYNEGKRALALYIHSRLDTQKAERFLTEQKGKQDG